MNDLSPEHEKDARPLPVPRPSDQEAQLSGAQLPGTTLLRRLRPAPVAGLAMDASRPGASHLGTAREGRLEVGPPVAERAAAFQPDADLLRQALRTAPVELCVQSAPLVPGERADALALDGRSDGAVHEDDFRHESELRQDDLSEGRTERDALLRRFVRDRAGQAGSRADFAAFLQAEEWFQRSPWLARTLLQPWSVQAHARSGVLLLAPRERERFASFTRVPGLSTAQPAGRREVSDRAEGNASDSNRASDRPGTGRLATPPDLEQLTNSSTFTEALAGARLSVVRAATTRLFSDWEQEADDEGARAQPAGNQSQENQTRETRTGGTGDIQAPAKPQTEPS